MSWKATGFCLALVMVGFPAIARADCDSAVTTARKAVDASDFDHFDEVRQGLAACEASKRSLWSDELARGLYREAVSRIRKKGQTLAEQRPLIDKALGFGEPYELLALQCRLNHLEKRFAEAQSACEMALTRIQDTDRTPNPPNPEAIERIFKLAEESRLLASTYKSSPTTRSGEASGISAPLLRGFTVKKVAIPIQFQYGKADFTEDGTHAAADLVTMLRQQQPQHIKLIGHTDPAGTDAYNDALSLSRAQAVQRFIQEHIQEQGQGQGVKIAIAIDVEGHGKREPYQPASPDELTEDQLHQLSRRVELVRQ